MFGKAFGARIEKASIFTVRVKKEERRSIGLRLYYDLTEQLAEAIGGHAPLLRETLMATGDLPARLGSGKLGLDTKAVSIRLQGDKENKLEIEETSYLSAKASRPDSAGGSEPVLAVGVTFPFGDDGEADAVLAFVRQFLGQQIKVRMDRKQVELPLGGAEA